MTIRRGEPWGEQVESPRNLPVAPDDRYARSWVTAHLATGRALQAIGLGGGDMARTLGGGSPGRFPGIVTKAPVDLVRVEAVDRTTWSLAHVVARRSWWRGEVVFAMNAQYLTIRDRRYDVAPRGHPNDGKIDILRVAPSMPIRARRQARRRARTGTHLPHPQLVVTQAAATTLTFERSMVIWVDGVRWGTADSLTLTCEPDALVVYA